MNQNNLVDAPALSIGRNLQTGLVAELHKLHDEGQLIKVGIIGAGKMGTDLVTAISQMKGIVVGAIADRSLTGAPLALEIAGYSAEHGRICENTNQISKAIESGCIAITGNSSLVVCHPQIDVIIDATGRPEAGAKLGYSAIENGKHLIMMNLEADVTIGPYLCYEAKKRGLVYSVGAGDEPSAVLELIQFVTALGYPVVAAGKGKNNPFNIDAIPEDYREEASRRGLNARMLTEFIDGSKTMVEMSCIANATGLLIDKPGMHGPKCALEDLHRVLCPRVDGGVFSGKGRVDFTLGENVAPGVFVVIEMSHPRIRERMNYLTLGNGPYYTLYRPFHLISLEVPLSAARACIYGTADMQPMDQPVADVCALAKRDIATGEVLDSIGETCYRGWAMDVSDARKQLALPVGLLDGARAIAPIKKGELFTSQNTAVDESSFLVKMRNKQDSMLTGSN